MPSYELRPGDFIPGYGLVRYFRRNIHAQRSASDDRERLKIWAQGRVRLPILAVYHFITLQAAYDYLVNEIFK